MDFFSLFRQNDKLVFQWEETVGSCGCEGNSERGAERRDSPDGTWGG